MHTKFANNIKSFDSLKQIDAIQAIAGLANALNLHIEMEDNC